MKKLSSASEFEREIQGDQTAVVKFYADWCPDCKRLDQHFGQIISEYPTFNFYDVNVEELVDVAEGQDVRGIPSLLVFRNGQKVAHLHSANLKTPQQAREFLNTL
ncbi:thiol reductase thioredoxin [Paenibacillus sp. SSG-1]|uniref:Thioredoxin-like protein YdbP n=1 Tax=Paenibacillus cineris TaxID=237530 RepID=A0ABQ4L895_9BACL|nr:MULTISPECIES: thioredoxin family protein [Paenibacillus]OXL82469.1 thiol reductase thioredoxin [Paenibacillus sp. SSG-1]UYO03954.1 thioredoxin family protein [Paenibacillus sp. PSB04]GIO52807.1 thioredoxin-like protein YdbP [Paenibacillus cineris]